MLKKNSDRMFWFTIKKLFSTVYYSTVCTQIIERLFMKSTFWEELYFKVDIDLLIDEPKKKETRKKIGNTNKK